MTVRNWLWVTMAVAAIATLAAASGAGSRDARLGFTPEAFERQRRAEASFAQAISRSYISETHRAMTRRPHPAGSEAAREVAEYLRSELERSGLDVEVIEYLAYLSAPVEVAVEMLAPERHTFSLMEPADPRDPDTAHPELGPAYVAYSASADVTAPVVYVNYGLPADYEKLAAAGIDVRGRIVLARYGRSHRAVKVYTAQQAGAVGIILYSDPADDGFARGLVWPEGLWRSHDLIQRGNAKFSWFWHGDPLTPGRAATAGAAALDPAEAPTLPRIPVAAMSWAEAATILRRLHGSAVAPAGFQGGLPFTYHTGPGEVTVRLAVEMADGFTPIYNVVGRIAGTADPDRWVLVGTHHDAWTFGAIDPGSAAAVLLEVARGLADLKRAGWQPARSIVFGFWDAEEFGLIGSTEYAEDREAELMEKAAVYLNSDMYTPGRFVAGGSPSLRDFIAELAKDLPHDGGSLYDAWRESEWQRASPATRRLGADRFEVELNALGSGADFVAFQDYVGLPTLSLEFLFEGGWGYGTYHSNYDTRFYMERLSDPSFDWGARHARLLGTTVMRLAAAPVLPYRYSHYAQHIRAFLQEAERWAIDEEGRRRVAVDTGELQQLADTIEQRTRRLEARLDTQLQAGRVPARAGAINDVLMRLDQTLLDRSEPADVRWYRHLIYGWNIYALYAGQPLPHLYEAIRVADDVRVSDEMDRIRQALLRMLAAVDEAIEAAAVD
jgi:N-acetylated-alpha-linked acidic dipeptidase